MPGITQSQMIGLLNATLSKFLKGRFIGTQQLQSYPAVEKFILAGKNGTSFDSLSFEWEVAMRTNVGSFRGVNFHEAWSALEGPAPTRAKVDIIKYEGKGIVIDARERKLNAGPGQIVDIVKVKRDRFFAEVFKVLETDIFGRPTSTSETTKLWGLPMWARPSMTSGGVFTEDTTGGFNGTYIRYADGTTGASTLANIDASEVNNEEWRNWVFTHGGSMTIDVCKAVKRANNYTKFRAYPKKIGDTVMGMVSVFMCQEFHEEYINLVNNGPDDRGTGGNKADLFPFQDGTLNGVNIIRTPQLDSDATLPIYGVRHDHTYIARMPEFWFKESGFREKPNAHNSLYSPIDVCGNLICESPREAIWTGHGSF